MAYGLLALALASLVILILGVLGLLEKLPRNHVAGIRTPFTMASDENWYRTHRTGAPFLIFGGVAALMASLAFLPFAFADKLGGGLLAGVAIALAVVLAGCALLSWLVGTASARRASSAADPPPSRLPRS